MSTGTTEGVWLPESFNNRPYARENFRNIINWAVRHHPFYRRHILDPGREIPLLTRDIVCDNNELLLNGNPETGRTSGSTGIPVSVSWSELKEARERHSTDLFVNWMGGPLPRAQLIYHKDAAGRADSLDICRPLADQAEFIFRRRHESGIRALVTFPTNAVNLAGYVIENGLDMSFIERIVCYAEAIDQSQLRLISQAFPNARAWTTYSCREVGFIASTCPYDSRYHHIMGQNLGVEVINDEGKPCEVGETGRIVVTDYFNRNSPFIRYEVGDLAIPGECPCGKIPTPALKEIIGRVRGFLRREDGTPVAFVDIMAALLDLRWLRQYQVIQDKLKSIRFRYVPLKEINEVVLHNKVKMAFTDSLGFSPDIIFIREKEIAREKSGKFHVSICNIE